MRDPRSKAYRLLGLVTLTLCLLQGGTASALQSRALPDSVTTLEAEGKLAEARQQLEGLKTQFVAAELNAHIELIARTADILALADALARHGLVKQASAALEKFLPEVSTVRDAGLAIVVHRRLAELQNRSPAQIQQAEAIERAARNSVARADTYFNRGAYKNAKEAYDAVAKQTEAISDSTRTEAKIGVDKATQALFDEEPNGVIQSLVRSVRDVVRTIWLWVLTLLVVASITFMLRPFWLIDKRSLELVDLSVMGASQAANRELAQALQDVIDRIRQAGPAFARLDAAGTGDTTSDGAGTLPPPDLVFVTAPLDAPSFAKEVDAFVSSTPAVAVGAIGINPQQLWTFIKRTLTPRPRHAFTGTLVEYNGALTLRLTYENLLVGGKTEWRASAAIAAPGDARLSCIVEIACRIVLSSESANTVTRNIESLKAYVLGLYALTSKNSEASKQASEHFREALDRDNGNWLARFHLALCARGAKDARVALRHLRWFSGPEGVASDSLQAYIKEHSDFPHVLSYQLASTLSMASEDREWSDVGRLLDRLIALETSAEGQRLTAEKRLRLIMLARSGQSSRESVRASLIPKDEKGKRKLGEIRERLFAHLRWFNQHDDALQRAAPSGHPLSRGVVLHALGRVLFASGDRKRVISSLSEAVDLMPGYPDVYVDLAKAHLELKVKLDWPQHVTSLLDRALLLDSSNAKAKFVYARFYFAEETRDYAKAEPYLSAAQFDPTSLFMLAQVLSFRGDHGGALALLERSIALRKRGPTYRVRLYAESLLELTKNVTVDRQATEPVVQRGRRKLCQYYNLFDQTERTKANYRRVAEIYPELCKFLGAEAGRCFPLPTGSSDASERIESAAMPSGNATAPQQ